jgi:Flp pilus assembly pilin Flp
MERIKQFMRDESGVVSTEYVVLGAVVIGALVAVAGLLTGAFNAFFTNLAGLLNWGAGEIAAPGAGS